MAADEALEKIIQDVSQAILLWDGTKEEEWGRLGEGLDNLVRSVGVSACDEMVQHAVHRVGALHKQCSQDVSARDSFLSLLQQTISALHKILFQSETPACLTSIPALGLSTDEDISSGGSCDERLLREFLEQQVTVMDELEALVLLIETNRDNAALVKLKGFIHTIKGESGILQLAVSEKLCHDIEDRIEREGLDISIDQLLKDLDELRCYFERLSRGLDIGSETAPDVHKADSPSAQEEAYYSLEDVDLIADFVNEANEHLTTADEAIMRYEFQSDDMELINAIFRSFHTIKGIAGMLSLSDVHHIAHQTENILDSIRKSKLRLEGPVVDIVLEASDALKDRVGVIRAALESDLKVFLDPGVQTLVERLKQVVDDKKTTESPPSSQKAIGEILVEQGCVSPDTIQDALYQQATIDRDRKIGEILVDNESIQPKDLVQALQEQKQPGQSQGAVTMKETIKVDMERLDSLIDTIGELVISQAMVSDTIHRVIGTDERMIRNMRLLEKTSKNLQEMGLSLRMMPVKSVFDKMARLVRDLSKKSQKKIRFSMTGEETELDKSVIEKVADPLIHMVRNSCDHGIESNEADRVALGKNPEGQISLCAYHKGGNVVIKITDDGRGLNKDAIYKKGIEKGLIQEHQVLSDREIYNLIFTPGFSTAQKITDISGRGVGMDVVKRNIEALRGKIEIDTRIGQGTSFSIYLPLTLAIIDGIVVRTGHRRYIIPTHNIIEFMCPCADDVSHAFDRGESLNLRGECLPIYRLSRLFQLDNAREELSGTIIVVIENENRHFGLMVDDIVGQQQIVIKTLGHVFQKMKGIAGGAIMPDGSVGLILDLSGLVRLALEQKDMEEMGV